MPDRSERLLMACEGEYIDIRILRVTARVRSIGLDDACALLDDLVKLGWVERQDAGRGRCSRRMYRITESGRRAQERVRLTDRREVVACA